MRDAKSYSSYKEMMEGKCLRKRIIESKIVFNQLVVCVSFLLDSGGHTIFLLPSYLFLTLIVLLSPLSLEVFLVPFHRPKRELP